MCVHFQRIPLLLAKVKEYQETLPRQPFPTLQRALDPLQQYHSSFISVLIFIVCGTGTLAMATTIGFQKKVKNKLKNKEENNNDESLVCDVCSVVCKSTANLRKHQQRTHDDREYTCDTCGIKVTGLVLLCD